MGAWFIDRLKSKLKVYPGLDYSEVPKSLTYYILSIVRSNSRKSAIDY